MKTNFYELHFDHHRILLQGDWVTTNYEQLSAALAHLEKRDYSIDLSGIQSLDTAGILQLVDRFGGDSVRVALDHDVGMSPERRHMISTVLLVIHHDECIVAPKKTSSLSQFFIDAGEMTVAAWMDFKLWCGFFGMVLVTFFQDLPNPKRWRVTSVMANIDSSGFQAMLIVMLLCFMVGTVVAFLGSTILAAFGAQIFTVQLVAYSFLREFAIILTAILIAGRTASAYTAQLGSMKVNEEIDALKASGSDPIRILVIPRVLSLLISMPILTFFGMVAGILGGMLVCAINLNISPVLFVDVIYNNIAVQHFLVGISKAPLFAIVIAITGCIEGFKVTGSAQSVGERTTTSVVKCIFVVILLDALCAIFFMEMGW